MNAGLRKFTAVKSAIVRDVVSVSRHTMVSSRSKFSTSRSRNCASYVSSRPKGLGFSSRVSDYFVSSRRFVRASTMHSFYFSSSAY